MNNWKRFLLALFLAVPLIAGAQDNNNNDGDGKPEVTGLDNAADKLTENAEKNEGHGNASEVLLRNAEKLRLKATLHAERKQAKLAAKQERMELKAEWKAEKMRLKQERKNRNDE